MTTSRAKSRKRLILKILAVMFILVIGWVAYDLYAPRTAHLREFDPDEVAPGNSNVALVLQT